MITFYKKNIENSVRDTQMTHCRCYQKITTRTKYCNMFFCKLVVKKQNINFRPLHANGNFLLLLLFSMNFLVQMIKERKKLSSLIFDNSKCMGRDQSMRRRKEKNKHH